MCGLADAVADHRPPGLNQTPTNIVLFFRQLALHRQFQLFEAMDHQPSAANWRLWACIPSTDVLGEELTREAFAERWGNPGLTDTYKTYLKHWFAKHAGEVASARGAYTTEPTDADVPQRFFHPQMAISSGLRKQFEEAGHGRAAADALVSVRTAADWGNTTMVEFISSSRWRYRTHNMITLPELVWDWKEECTAMEIYFWYSHALKCIKKRSHPTGNPDRVEAARLRKK